MAEDRARHPALPALRRLHQPTTLAGTAVQESLGSVAKAEILRWRERKKSHHGENSQGCGNHKSPFGVREHITAQPAARPRRAHLRARAQATPKSRTRQEGNRHTEEMAVTGLGSEF